MVGRAIADLQHELLGLVPDANTFMHIHTIFQEASRKTNVPLSISCNVADIHAMSYMNRSCRVYTSRACTKGAAKCCHLIPSDSCFESKVDPGSTPAEHAPKEQPNAATTFPENDALK
eukprot:1161556-Pelagomonas_calceolata.AAC.4